MKSNYRAIGEFIQLVKTKNIDGKIDLLLGININKYFMPSVANVIGTNLARYKVVKPNQFACNRMHVGRDYRLPIALSQFEYDFIVSPAYDVFEIKDTKIILPEYLMMWFLRKEFDRNAWFYTDTDVRGKLGWEDFCNMQLPVPSIEKQQEIVDEYNTIVDRIKLNEQLNQKLEEMAQAIYRQWFVDFEFPDSEGKPYKSNGGKMVYYEELDIEIPKGWESSTLNKICLSFDNLRKPLSGEERDLIKGEYPYYGAMSIIDYINDYIYDGTYLLVSEDGANVVDEKGRASTQYIWGKFWLNNHAHIIQGKNNISTEFLMLALKTKNIAHLITGAAQPKINQKNLMSIEFLKPPKEITKQFDINISSIFSYIKTLKELSTRLFKLKQILLLKLATIKE